MNISEGGLTRMALCMLARGNMCPTRGQTQQAHIYIFRSLLVSTSAESSLFAGNELIRLYPTIFINREGADLRPKSEKGGERLLLSRPNIILWGSLVAYSLSEKPSFFRLSHFRIIMNMRRLQTPLPLPSSPALEIA